MQSSPARQIDLPFTSSEWLFFAAVAVLNLAFDAALMWFEHQLIVLSRGGLQYFGWVESFAISALFAQLVIFAIWASLFDGSNLLRVLSATLGVCLSWYLLRWIAGTIAPTIYDYRELDGILGLPMIIVIFFAAQFPFWMLRFFRGWRIHRIDATEHLTSTARRFTMLHMLGWAAFLSLPLSMARVYDGRGAAAALLGMACVTLATWIFGLLYLWATLGARQIAWGLIICMLASIAMTIITAQALVWLNRAPAGWVHLAFFVMQAGVAGIGLGTGIAARTFGYRLRKGPSSQP